MEALTLLNRPQSRPIAAGFCVVMLHLLLGIALRHEAAPQTFLADQLAPSPLYILPIVVEHFKPLPPIPDPVLRTVPPPEWVTPTVELPTSPLDVMAVTIVTTNTSDGNDERCTETNPAHYPSATASTPNVDPACDRRRVSRTPWPPND
jgi:hypothetical protein